MKLFANENFPIVSIRKLREVGFDVVSVAEIMRGAPDSDVLMHAAKHDQIILTFDRDTVSSFIIGKLPYPRV
jgi:predicted nuclease of predicted toxin-antitoxin system